MHPQPLQYNPQVVKEHWYHKILQPEMKVIFTLDNFPLEHPVYLIDDSRYLKVDHPLKISLSNQRMT